MWYSLWCLHGLQPCMKLSHFLSHGCIDHWYLSVSSWWHASKFYFTQILIWDMIPLDENPHHLLGLSQPPNIGSFIVGSWISSRSLVEPSKYLPHAFSHLAAWKFGFARVFLLQQSLLSDPKPKPWDKYQLSREFRASEVPKTTHNVSPKHRTHDHSIKGMDWWFSLRATNRWYTGTPKLQDFGVMSALNWNNS